MTDEVPNLEISGFHVWDPETQTATSLEIAQRIYITHRRMLGIVKRSVAAIADDYPPEQIEAWFKPVELMTDNLKLVQGYELCIEGVIHMCPYLPKKNIFATVLIQEIVTKFCAAARFLGEGEFFREQLQP